MRAALIHAAISILNRSGYNAATTAAIADEAGVSRGSITYHFGSRLQLMAEVIRAVHDQEHAQFDALEESGFDGSRASHWPEMLWRVLSKPSGMAVLEILVASRSDPELAAIVIPAQNRVERVAAVRMKERFAADEAEVVASMRLFVWAIRGLSIARVLVSDPAEIDRSIDAFRLLAERGYADRQSPTGA